MRAPRRARSVWRVTPAHEIGARIARARVAAALIVALGIGAGGALVLAPCTACAQHYVVSPNSKFPRLLYADSLISVNDRCVVTQRQLNPQIPPVYVNGKPVGFC